MSRLWKNYINQQLYSECQLITALNAYYYLTGNVIGQDSQEYEELINLCSAMHGSAIDIEKVHSKFGIEPIGYSNHTLDIELDRWYKFHTFRQHYIGYDELKLPEIRDTRRLPIEVSVWHKKTGFHSVLIVDYCDKTECYRIANFSCATSLKGWMFAEDLYQFTNDCNKGWKFRTFGLITP